MTPRSRLCLATTVAVATSHLICGSAWGDPDAGVPFVDVPLADSAPPHPPTAPLQPGGSYLHLRSLTHVKTLGGSELDIAPGYYVDEPSWTKLDMEFRRLQDRETRLEAENKSLRKSMETWQPGWVMLTATLVVGLAGGFYVHSKL